MPIFSLSGRKYQQAIEITPKNIGEKKRKEKKRKEKKRKEKKRKEKKRKEKKNSNDRRITFSVGEWARIDRKKKREKKES